MRSLAIMPRTILPLTMLVIASSLAACAENPVVQQATVDTRFDPVRADTMVAVNFAPSAAGPDYAQVSALRSVVEKGRRAQRDEFAVVSDGSGGAIQSARAQRIAQTLSDSGARWVTTSVEPAMAMGPNTVVIVRSEYLLGFNNCPNYIPATQANPNEGAMPGFGCADAYNMGQMLARPRDAAVGRSPGPADGTVSADAVQRYREGRVRDPQGSSTGGAGGGAAGGGAAGGGGGGGGAGAATSTP
jgi:type IV pilus biogenesis protein CpaD/CtpE